MLKQLNRFLIIITIGGGSYYLVKHNEESDWFVFMFFYLFVGILLLADWYFFGPHLKEKNINLLIKYFYTQSEFPPENDIRMVVHKKISETQYKQYTNYFPEGTKKGKKYPIRKGIVYYAFTQAKGEFSENFENNPLKKKELQAKYNYSEKEAEQQIVDGEMSYYCRPIVKDEKIWGVLYMKAKKCGSFSQEAELPKSLLSKNASILIKMIENEIH